MSQIPNPTWRIEKIAIVYPIPYIHVHAPSRQDTGPTWQKPKFELIISAPPPGYDPWILVSLSIAYVMQLFCTQDAKIYYYANALQFKNDNNTFDPPIYSTSFIQANDLPLDPTGAIREFMGE